MSEDKLKNKMEFEGQLSIRNKIMYNQIRRQ